MPGLKRDETPNSVVISTAALLLEDRIDLTRAEMACAQTVGYGGQIARSARDARYQTKSRGVVKLSSFGS
jgi:hypothetical protein